MDKVNNSDIIVKALDSIWRCFMGKRRTTTVHLSEEAAEFLSQLPKGMRSKFINLLLLEAIEKYDSPSQAMLSFLSKLEKKEFEDEEEESKLR